MSLQMAFFHCLLFLSNIPLLHVLHLYPFLCCWDILGASRVLAIVDSAAMNAGVHSFLFEGRFSLDT